MGAPLASADDLLLEYRIRTVRIGIWSTGLALASLVVYSVLPGRPPIHAGAFVAELIVAVVGVVIVATLPWARILGHPKGMFVFYAWSLLDIGLIALLIGATGGPASAAFLLFALTNLFFAASYPTAGQVWLTVITSVAYVVAVRATGPLRLGETFMRLAILALVVYMASYLSRELMRKMVALASARRESERRANLLAIVARRARDFTVLSANEVLDGVTASALELGFEAAEICLIDEETDSYEVVYARNLPESYTQGRHSASEGIVGRALRTRAVVMADYSLVGDGIAELREIGFRSTLAAPIEVAGRVSAVLSAGLRSARELQPEEVEAFELLAVQAGRALENARRIEEVEQRADLEAQLHQAQRLEMVGHLAGGIAHDFNNLLTVISSCAAFVARDLPDEDPRREDLDEIQDASARGSRLVRQLLEFSRRRSVDAQLVDINHTVRDLERLLDRAVGDEIILTLGLAEELPAVRIDRGHVEQILLNLAVNARDAMPAGGTLEIRTAAEDATEGRRVVVSVRDDGEGMDPDTMARIFDPFFTTKEVGRGTGLGLATTRGLVRQAGGRIGCRSAPGAGTTFRIELPVGREVTPIVPDEGILGDTVALGEPSDALEGSSPAGSAELPKT